MLNKFYLPFFVALGLFLIIVTYSIVIYSGWEKMPDNGYGAVEISLPVIDWGKYNGLSKQLE